MGAMKAARAKRPNKGQIMCFVIYTALLGRRKLFLAKASCSTAPVIYTRFESADVCLQIKRASADVLSQNPSMYITGAVSCRKSVSRKSKDEMNSAKLLLVPLEIYLHTENPVSHK